MNIHVVESNYKGKKVTFKRCMHVHHHSYMLIFMHTWHAFMQFPPDSVSPPPIAQLSRGHNTYSPVQPLVTPPPWLPGRQATVRSCLIRGHCYSHQLPVATVGCTPAVPVAVLEVWRWRYTWMCNVSILC